MKNLFFSLIIIVFAALSLLAQEPSPDEFREMAENLTAVQIKDFQLLAEEGNPKAQVIVGLVKQREAVPFNEKKDYKNYGNKLREGLSWFMKADEQNYAPAQYFLAEAYEEQNGVSLDCVKVLNWIDKAMASEYAAAFSYKAWFYLSKRCVERDYQKSLELYKKSYSLGQVWGAIGAGNVLSEYLGGSENQKEANVWYLKAAEAGSATAQDKIGIRISEGIGTNSNNKEAVKWFKKSAEQGHVYGSCNLALHYARGWGIAKNPLLALKWSFVSNSLDGLKCAPADFIQLLKPSKIIIRNASKLAVTWLKQHPKLTNNFDERPWLGEGDNPVPFRER